MIRFRERMVGPVGPVCGVTRTVPPRGVHGGDGVVRLAATTVDARPTVLDLDDLHVEVEDLDRTRDGFPARITRGTVVGVASAPLDVVCGFADILTVAHGGRRMHYRLLVEDGRYRYVVEGVKAVRGGLRSAWSGTTTLHTVVVRVGRVSRVGRVGPEVTAPADAARWLADGGFSGEVVAAGVLRVRGLLRQGRSLRGPVLPFLLGFARRAVRV